MAGVRERVRAEMTAEILRLAREQLAIGGAEALSLRAIARDLGVVSSAIYRYVPSRDDLLTRLIVDSYERLGDAVESADATVADRADYATRWQTMARALRGFAFEHPSEWALLFGTPVPGYRAPVDTVGPATRYTASLTGLLADMEAAGARFATPAAAESALAVELTSVGSRLAIDVSGPALTVGMEAWAALMGAISLELFGHLHNVVAAPAALFDAVSASYGARLVAALPARRRRRGT